MKVFTLKNLRLKVLSFLFATALWFFVAGQSRTEVGFLVPLVLKEIPRDIAISGPKPGEIEVRVSGPKFVINNLTPAQVIAEVDLSSAREGLNTYKVSPQNIVVPSGVEVVWLRPSSVEIVTERTQSVSIPIRARLKGSPQRGFRVKRVSVFPESVTATGIKHEIREIRGLQVIYTQAVDISGISETRKFPTGLDSPEGDFIMSPANVNVLVTVEKAR